MGENEWGKLWESEDLHILGVGVSMVFHGFRVLLKVLVVICTGFFSGFAQEALGGINLFS